MQVHWKIQFLGGVHKKPIYRGNCLKGRLGEFADLRGGGGGEGRGAWWKRRGLCYQTPMHTMLKNGDVHCEICQTKHGECTYR